MTEGSTYLRVPARTMRLYCGHGFTKWLPKICRYILLSDVIMSGAKNVGLDIVSLLFYKSNVLINLYKAG